MGSHRRIRRTVLGAVSLSRPEIWAEHLVADVVGGHATLHQLRTNVPHEGQWTAGENVEVIRQRNVREVHVALAGARVARIEMLVPGIGDEVVELMPHPLDRLAKRMILSCTVGVGRNHWSPWLGPDDVLHDREHGGDAGAGTSQKQRGI